MLVRDAVIVNLASKGKNEVLAEMANALAKAEPGIDPGCLLNILMEREALQSTGVGEGVAIPHGKISGLDHPVVSFARSVAGVDFGSIDNRWVNLVFLLVAPEHAGELYLKALARISRLCRDAELRGNLYVAEKLEDVVKAIEDVDGKLQ